MVYSQTIFLGSIIAIYETGISGALPFYIYGRNYHSITTLQLLPYPRVRMIPPGIDYVHILIHVATIVYIELYKYS
jgi:hypothetical protein